jgi:hypothetical protein
MIWGMREKLSCFMVTSLIADETNGSEQRTANSEK